MSKVTDFTADTTPTSDDLVYVINAPGGTPGDRKVTLANLVKAFAAESPTFAGLTVTGMLVPSTTTVSLDSDNSQTWVTAIEAFGGNCTIMVSGVVTGSAASCGILVQEGTTGLSSDILTHDGAELQFRITEDDLQVASISPGLEGESVKVTVLKLG